MTLPSRVMVIESPSTPTLPPTLMRACRNCSYRTARMLGERTRSQRAGQPAGTHERGNVEDVIIDGLRAVDGDSLGLAVSALLLETRRMQHANKSDFRALYSATAAAALTPGFFLPAAFLTFFSSPLAAASLFSALGAEAAALASALGAAPLGAAAAAQHTCRQQHESASTTAHSCCSPAARQGNALQPQFHWHCWLMATHNTPGSDSRHEPLIFDFARFLDPKVRIENRCRNFCALMPVLHDIELLPI